jgi:transcriptional regulator with XRE-family HTH domain
LVFSLKESSRKGYYFTAKIEGGVVTKPSVQTIQKIAKSLGVAMEDLLK